MRIEENKEILDWVFMDDEDFLFLYLMEYFVCTGLQGIRTRFAEFMRESVRNDVARSFL